MHGEEHLVDVGLGVVDTGLERARQSSRTSRFDDFLGMATSLPSRTYGASSATAERSGACGAFMRASMTG
jgi:hypothetical protein